MTVESKKKPWEVEWKLREIKLKELIKEIKSGFALSKQKRRKIGINSGIPQLRPYNIANWNKINLDELTYIPQSISVAKDYFIKTGDVLFNNTNSTELVGRAIVYKGLGENYTYSNHITRIRVNEQIITPDFLSWNINFLWSKNFFHLKATKWIGQAGISNRKLLSIKIPIPFRNGKPDLETQKKIVEYIESNFSIIDKILEKKKKELEHLDELWESILAQSLKPKKGEEWKEFKLGDVFHIESGSRPKGGVRKYVDGIPSIGGEHLNYDGTFSLEKLRYVPDAFYKKANKGKIKKYDILIVKDGATTGKTAFVNEQFPFEQAMVNEHVFLCRVKNNKIYPNFVFRFIASKEGQHRILKTKGGTAQGGINKQFSKLVKIPIPFRNSEPDIEKQKEIANYLDSVYEKIKLLKEKIQNQITHLEEMKESILDEVFNHNELE